VKGDGVAGGDGESSPNFCAIVVRWTVRLPLSASCVTTSYASSLGDAVLEK
jgi:hypothetical protein